MKLDIQIITIFYYISFGLFFAINFNLFYRYLFYTSKYISLISIIVFMLIMFFIFVITNTVINHGNIHIYFLGIFILFFIIGNKVFKFLRCKL